MSSRVAATPWWAALLLAVACGGPGEDPGPTAATRAEPPAAGNGIAPEAAAASAAAAFEREDLNLRFELPGPPWERIEPSGALPEAVLELERSGGERGFALVALELGGGGAEVSAEARQAAMNYLARRAKVLEVEEERPLDLQGLAATLTIAQGVVGQQLVRLADVLLVTSDLAYHLVTWGPLLRADAESLAESAGELARGFSLIDPTRAAEAFAAFDPVTGSDLVRLFDFRVTGAAFSRGLHRLVLLTDDPPAIHVVEPDRHEVRTIDLEYTPLEVAIDPNGRLAAVSHHARLSLVNLEQERLVVSRSLTVEPAHLVFTGDGWVYMTLKGTSWKPLVGAKLPGGLETRTRGSGVSGDAPIRLHPLGKGVYTASRYSSPDRLEKLDVSEGTPRYAYRWPYHGEHAACGDLWLSEDGRRIFTACGNVFRSSPAREHDMTYAGRLEGAEFISWLDDCSSRGRIVVLAGRKPRTADRTLVTEEVRIYDSTSLTVRRVDRMPEAIVDGEPRQPLVHRAFASGACDAYYALLRLPPDAAGVERFGLLRREL